MKKVVMLLAAMMVTALILSGCGSKEAEEDKTADASETEEAETKEQEEETEDESEEEEETEEEVPEEDAEETAGSDTSGPVDFSELISYMEKETEGTANVLYENAEPQVHESKGITVSLNAYTLMELIDFHTDFSIPFNDETDGGVIMAQYTVTNDTDEEVYYMPTFDLSYTGAPKIYSNNRNLIPLEEQLPAMLGPDNDYALEPGQSVTGYYTYSLGKSHLDTALDLSTVSVDVPPAQAVKGEFGSPIGQDGKFNLSLNEEGAEKVAANAAFYEDKVTIENMGEKKMLVEKEAIGENQELGDVNVTLEGYQFTEFTPNEVEAPRFENFQNGIVLLTVKFILDNGASDNIGLSGMTSKLTVNDGMQYMLGQGMLLDYRYSDVIEAGESGELLQIYTLDQEQYAKIWKDKAFEVEIGPIKNQDGKDISKGKKATFEL